MLRRTMKLLRELIDWHYGKRHVIWKRKMVKPYFTESFEELSTQKTEEGLINANWTTEERKWWTAKTEDEKWAAITLMMQAGSVSL